MRYIFSESKVFENIADRVIQKMFFSFSPTGYYLTLAKRFSQAIFIASHVIKKFLLLNLLCFSTYCINPVFRSQG